MKLTKKSKLKKVPKRIKIKDSKGKDKVLAPTKVNYCEHGKVGYKELCKLSQVLFKRIKMDEKYFGKLVKIIETKEEEKQEHKKSYEDVVDFYEDKLAEFIRANKELATKNYELTRAYNSLHAIGKEVKGFDIKKYNKELPENNKYDFTQKHDVLESGKVRSTYTLTPKDKGKKGDK